jgi:hypothetical protein
MGIMSVARMLRLFALLPLLALGSALAACSSAPDEAPPGPAVDTGEDPVTAECIVDGFDCSKAGALCTKKCFDSDGAKDVFVKFSVDGRVLDSRAIPFTPVQTSANALRYGCGLFTATDGAQGLQVLYKKNGADKDAFTDDTLVRIDDFLGPGRYTAAARYIARTEDLASGKTYAKKDGCTLEVAHAGAGGLKGTISCPSVPLADGSASVAVTGEFACPGSALSPIYSSLP